MKHEVRMSNPFSQDPIDSFPKQKTPDPHQWSGGGAENPYASPNEVSGRVVETPYGILAPHRGGTVLTLGILGVICDTFGAMVCGLSPVVGLALSIPAWVMGRNDLRAIDAGKMDPMGRGSTLAGMILGIIGTVLGVLVTILMVAAIVFFVALLSQDFQDL